MRYLWFVIISVAGTAVLWQAAAQAPAQPNAKGKAAGQIAAQIAMDPDDIAGIVTSANGPEAGIWVIAETTDLDTKFRKIVVTDDQGRYLLPDLPSANYSIWTRGYGLVDSAKVTSKPGARLNLTAVIAPSAAAAAQYYPANYWYSLIHIPPASEFPGTGPQGNRIDPAMATQDHWINQIKANCVVCHQIGNEFTRQFPATLGTFPSSVAAWDHRVKVGQDGRPMTNAMDVLGRQRGLEMFADWTDRVAAGELPPVPPRPQGIERNLVLTLWDWGGRSTFAHDELTTDKRNPTANPNGLIYGVDWGNDAFLIVDPVRHSTTEMGIPVLDPRVPPGKPQSMPAPSPYWGDQLYWFDPAITNHAAMDSKGRVWMSSRFRLAENQPAFCASHPSAALSPQPTGFRQIQYYDPAEKKFHQVDTCFDTHHVQFASDKDETIYSNGVFSGAIGWVKTRVLEETGDLAAAQGWCRPYYDINQDGKIDLENDRRVPFGGFYSVIAHPSDGTIWAAAPGPMPGKIIHIDPRTCASRAYEPPFRNPAVQVSGYTPRGIDITSDGVVWTALASSGHLASFDERKCKVLTGPASTDPQHCAEGWTLYPTPGPRLKGVQNDIGADFHYYNFVDRFNTLGLGENVPVANGSASDSLVVLQPDGSWAVLRVPYPMGFFSRGMDGRIDDPNGGWKGRAMYADYGQNAIWHTEGGLGTKSAVVKFQIRPDPLAK